MLMDMKMIIATYLAVVRYYHGTESAQVLPPVGAVPKTLVFTGGSFLNCKEEVLSSDQRIMGTPRACELLKRETEECGRNGQDCTANRLSRSNDHIRHKSQHSKTNRDPCCNMLRRKQNEKVCGEGGTYECHGNDRPQCNCPVGRKGLHCEDISTEYVNCSCVNDKYRIINQDTYVDCNSMDKRPEWTKCFLHKDGLNCLCLKGLNGSTAEMPSCSKPSESPLSSSSGKLSSYFVLIVIVLLVVK